MKLMATDSRRFMPPLYCRACLSATRLFHRLTARSDDSTADWSSGPVVYV